MPVVPTTRPELEPIPLASREMMELAAGEQNNAELRSYTPTLRERMKGWLAERLGDDREAARDAEQIMSVLDLTPVGLATMAYDAGRSADSPAGAAVGAAELGLAIFAGPAAKTANLRKLAEAARMEKAGIDTPEIWYETGWARGADRQWRFEISDEQSRLTRAKGKYRLGEGLKHPELYKAYPGLQYRPVAEVELSGQGMHYPDTDHIELASWLNQVRDDKKSVVLHEVQHMVQKREGFAYGGTGEGEFATWLSKSMGKIQELQKAGKYEEAAKLWRMRETALRQSEKVSNEVYSLLAGEVEARNVQFRQAMPAWERQTLAPEVTEDVPRDQQILRFLSE